MYLEQLKSGARVQLQRPGDPPNGGFMCKVEVPLLSSRHVLIHAPSERNRRVELDIGTLLNVRLLTENATYIFKAHMVSYGDVDGFEVIKIYIEDDGTKIQRRSAFRFNCAIQISYAVVYSSGQQAERENAIASDLSAGGTKIFTNKNLPSGTLLNITIPLDDKMVIAFGDVRTKIDLSAKAPFKYQYGIRFAMMPESDQELIIQHMYKLQRDDLKKVRAT